MALRSYKSICGALAAVAVVGSIAAASAQVRPDFPGAKQGDSGTKSDSPNAKPGDATTK